jgi:hypothetical protein
MFRREQGRLSTSGLFVRLYEQWDGGVSILVKLTLPNMEPAAQTAVSADAHKVERLDGKDK